MAEWYVRYPDDNGDYVVVFKSKIREEAKAVEKVCCAVMDGLVKPDRTVWIKEEAE